MKTKKLKASYLFPILALFLSFQGPLLANGLNLEISESHPDPIPVAGTVTDQEGETLIGVNVQVKGTTKGTSTDFEGRYELTEVDENAVLVFSYIGYQTLEVPVDSRETIDITLASNAELLEEVVVVGYGVQKKVNLTGSVDVITQDDIQNRSVTNVTEALQGVSPNLNISQTGTSGEPGGGLNINIRGIGSLTGDASPYILVDGLPMDINDINPNDIESISVLKDAAASAIYGSRAPYGVILITTKTGRTGESKPQIEYSNNFSFSSPIGLPHMTNSLNFVTAYDQASVNAGLSPNFTEMNIQRIRQYMEGEISEETWKLPNENDWAGNGTWNIAGNGNNDWLHIFYDNNVLRQKHDMSIRGGGDQSTYYFSAGLWDQPGELKFGDQFYKRYNITTNLSSRVTNWLTFNLNSKFVNEKFQYFNTTQGWNRTTQYHNFLRTNPFRPLYLPNGEYSVTSNISMMEDGGKEVHNGTILTTRLSAVLEPVRNWETTVSYNYRGEFLNINNNRSSVFGSLPNGERVIVAYPLSSYISSKYDDNYQLFNIVSNYQFDLNRHYFSILGGFEQELNQHSGVWGQQDNIITSSVPSISTSTGQIYLSDEKSHWATQGVFGRLQYRYAGKYLAELNARYDGSSRFAEGNRWGFFPSVSLGYIISEENFWEPLRNDINELKIRTSWGRLGNQNVANYLYIERLGISTNLGWVMGSERPNYATSPGIISPDLTWETSETKNIGFNASFLDYRLDFSLDVFERITRDMFGPSEALPILLGTSPPRQNNASLKTSGFELSIGWKDEISNDLSYNLRFNLADNKSIVTEYNNPTKTLSTWYEGQEIGEIWGLQTVGIYQNTAEAEAGPDQSLFYPTWGAGDMQYNDLDGDNKITRGNWTADNSGDYSVIGNSTPRYLVGFNGGIQWKDFSISLFVQGVGKRDFAFNGTANDIIYFGFNGQQWWNMTVMEQHLDYWRPADESNLLGPNPNGFYPKPYLSQEDYKNKQIQTRYTENAAYLRLKNVNLSYTLNPTLIQKIGFLQGAKIILSGENLATLTSLTKLVDPEALSSIGWGVGKIHPLRKTFAVGVNITF